MYSSAPLNVNALVRLATQQRLEYHCTIEEVLERKSIGSGLEIRDYGRRGSAALTTRQPLLSKNLALTSPTSGCRFP
jgi:hypothetical protein